MDAPRPAVRLSAVIVEIRALGSHCVFRFENADIKLSKQFSPNPKRFTNRMLGLETRVFNQFAFTLCFRALNYYYMVDLSFLEAPHTPTHPPTALPSLAPGGICAPTCRRLSEPRGELQNCREYRTRLVYQDTSRSKTWIHES